MRRLVWGILAISFLAAAGYGVRLYLYSRTQAQTQALHRLYEEVQGHAAMKAYLDDFWLLAALFAAFVPLVWCMARPPEPTDALRPVGAG